MSDTLRCDDKDVLVAYLYDELDGLTRRRMDEHVRVCAACASELKALTAVREELAGWAPPDADLGFSIVSASRAPSTDSASSGAWWRSAAVPGWARAAAAVLVVAAGLSIANVQVRYGADGLLITTGWMAGSAVAAPLPAATPTPVTTAAADEAWRPALSALDASLRREIREARVSETAPAPAACRAAELSVQRVATLIEQSERRQRQELALRLAQFGRDLEVQRRSDLVRINQGFGQFEGRAGAEIARQRQMIDYIMRVSTQPPPQ